MEDASIPVNNRGFAYGDGLFETCTGTKKQIHFLSDHLERLKEGLDVLGMENDWIKKDQIEKQIFNLIEKNNIPSLARIRIIAWRKAGGLFAPESNQAEYIIQVLEHQNNFSPKKKVLFYEEMRKAHSPVSRFKTLSALHYVMAGKFKKNNEADDVILLDPFNNVSECLYSNVFWINGSFVFTPSIYTGCIEGIMRKQILHYLKEKKLVCIEGEFSKKDVLNADFLFSSNATGLVPILSLENKKYPSSHPVFEELSKQFN